MGWADDFADWVHNETDLGEFIDPLGFGKDSAERGRKKRETPDQLRELELNPDSDWQQLVANNPEIIFDDLGYTTRLPGEHIAADVQHLSNRYVAARNQRLAQEAAEAGKRLFGQAQGALDSGLGNLQTYRPGGAAAMTSGLYQAKSQAYQRQAGFGLDAAQLQMTDAPDLMFRYNEAERDFARREARDANRLQSILSIASLITGGGGGGGGQQIDVGQYTSGDIQRPQAPAFQSRPDTGGPHVVPGGGGYASPTAAGGGAAPIGGAGAGPPGGTGYAGASAGGDGGGAVPGRAVPVRGEGGGAGGAGYPGGGGGGAGMPAGAAGVMGGGGPEGAGMGTGAAGMAGGGGSMEAGIVGSTVGQVTSASPVAPSASRTGQAIGITADQAHILGVQSTMAALEFREFHQYVTEAIDNTVERIARI